MSRLLPCLVVAPTDTTHTHSALSFRLFGKDLSNPTGERQLTSDKNQQAQAKAKKEKEAAAKQKALEDEALMDLENTASAASAAGPSGTTEAQKEEEGVLGDQGEGEGEEATMQAVEEEGQELATPPPEEEA